MYKKIDYLIKRFFFRLKNDGLIKVVKLFIKFVLNNNKKINLDEINLPNEKNLDDLFLIFGTDKGKLDGKKTFYRYYKNIETRSKFPSYREWVLRDNIYDYEYEMGQNFSSIYEKYFKNIKNEKLNILEIGVAGGHSHATWYKYFPNSIIYGIDIRPEKILLYSGSRLKYYSIDCTNQKQVQKFLDLGLSFDIIVDDSLHNYSGFIPNLINFFPLLKKNGYFFLEDFATADKKLKAQREYNEKCGKKLQGYSFTMEEIFNFLNKKTYFESRYFDKKHQKYFHENLKKFELFYLDFPESSLALLEKND